MQDDKIRKHPVASIEDLKIDILEELDFIFRSIEQITEEDKNMVKTYIAKCFDQMVWANAPRTAGEDYQKNLENYEEKIKAEKDHIKYLKKLRKAKEKLEEKEAKRYKELRKLYKQGQLDCSLEEEYQALRKKYKSYKSH